MRISVVCKDAIDLAGIQALLRDMPEVTLIPSDGSIEAAKEILVKGGSDGIVIASDQLSAEDFAELAQLRGRLPFRLVAISSFQSGQSNLAFQIADVLVARDKGAAGLHRAIGMLMQSKGRATAGSGTGKRRKANLTAREQEIAKYVAQGWSNRLIAEAVGLREQSVKNLVSVIMRKLDCENRVQVALQFIAEPTKIAG